MSGKTDISQINSKLSTDEEEIVDSICIIAQRISTSTEACNLKQISESEEQDPLLTHSDEAG